MSQIEAVVFRTVVVLALSMAVVLALGGRLLADPAAPAPPTAGSIHVKAQQMVYEGHTKLFHLNGDVLFEMKDTTATAAAAEFNTATQSGKLTGGVTIKQPGTVVTADHMLIFYDKRRAVLAGGVKLVTNKQSPGKADATAGAPVPPTGPNITTLTCEELEFFWEKQQGNAVGTVHIIQGDRQAVADTAHYDGTTQLVTLTGHVEFRRGAGDWLRAPVAVLNLKDQTFEAQQAEAYFTQEPKQNGKTTGPTGPKPAPTLRTVEPRLAPQLPQALPQDRPADLQTTTPSPSPSGSP